MYSSSNLNVPNSLYTDIAFFSPSKIDMHMNKVSMQEQVQGMKMRVECKREKKRMSVDIFGKKEVYLVPSACQHLIINTFAFADTKVNDQTKEWQLESHVC